MTGGAAAAHLRVNGRTVPLSSPSLAGLLADLGYRVDGPGLAVARNGEVVPRGRWTAEPVAAGDEIDVVGAVQGG